MICPPERLRLAAAVACAAALWLPAAAVEGALKCAVCETQMPAGTIEDCCCSAEQVVTANHHHFRPNLRNLRETRFFQYFKVDMDSECPFWREDFQCSERDCAVLECEPQEVPPSWLAEDARRKLEQGSSAAAAANPFAADCLEETVSGTHSGKRAPSFAVSGETAGSVDEMSALDSFRSTEGVDFQGWNAADAIEPWTSQRKQEEEMTYVNLLANPERYTGYQGQRIWEAIYGENCFGAPPAQNGWAPAREPACLEERAFFRVLSGLHSSINTHIAREFKYPSGEWGPNLPLYIERVGKHPYRLQNLYFAFLFVARAVIRAKEAILSFPIDTGDAVEDARTSTLLHNMLNESALTECASVVNGFDETSLFRVERGDLGEIEYLSRVQEKRRLRDDFRAKFQNVSRILDCVGCDKCKVWGKLQVLGLGTAVKILFAENVHSTPELDRNELIALINVFDRLAQSVDTAAEMQDLEFWERVQRFALLAAVGGAVLVMALRWLLCRRRSPRATSRVEKDARADKRE